MQTKEMKFLSKKEIEKIERILEKNYGSKLDFSEVRMIKTSGDKIWIISNQLPKIDLSKLKINSIGLYFGKLKDEKIRLSIEGCQFVGKYAKRNIAILNKDGVERFVRGYDAKPEKIVACEENNFVIVRYDDNYLGCGKLSNGIVKNLLPRARRLI